MNERLKEGDLRVWWVPQVPDEAFEVRVPNVETAHLIVDVLADYDKYQYEHGIKPDYCNAGGISRYEPDGNGGLDWFDLEDGS